MLSADELNNIQNQLYRIKLSLILIENNINTKGPSWAKDAVIATKKLGVVENPYSNGSLDYYRLLVLLHERDII